jgi:hypothetical protein
MKIVGHKTDSMPRRYDRVDREDLRAAVEGLSLKIEPKGDKETK